MRKTFDVIILRGATSSTTNALSPGPDWLARQPHSCWHLGQGPTRQQREVGRYVIDFIGLTAEARQLKARVQGDRDPGYGSTSTRIAESSLCLVKDVDRSVTGGGVWTPGAAMDLKLARRLQERAGLTFAIQG